MLSLSFCTSKCAESFAKGDDKGARSYVSFSVCVTLSIFLSLNTCLTFIIITSVQRDHVAAATITMQLTMLKSANGRGLYVYDMIILDYGIICRGKSKRFLAALEN